MNIFLVTIAGVLLSHYQIAQCFVVSPTLSWRYVSSDISYCSLKTVNSNLNTVSMVPKLHREKVTLLQENVDSDLMTQESTLTITEADDTNTESDPSTFTSNRLESDTTLPSSFSYGDFAKQYPFINNVAIATTKTGAADFIAQTVIGQTPIMDLDVQRSILFMLFGAVYSGGFQWLYQVQVFKKLFDIDKFTNLSLEEKLEDKEGLKALAMQTALDLIVLTLVYLPSFYIFKACVFSGSMDPSVWAEMGLGDYTTNFEKDESDLLKVWFPADLVCFSVPLYLRLPVRHGVSFLWTAYLSFARGGH